MALRYEGFRAFDADDGFSCWVDRSTGQIILDPPNPTPPGWIHRYGWKISAERVRTLAASAPGDLTFLCGSVENEAEVWRYFDHVVCLVADDETIAHRLATRTTNDFGKQPEELAAVLEWNPVLADRYRQAGATIVDSTQPLADVVAEVLAQVRFLAR